MPYATPQLAPVLLERLAPWLTPQADPYGDHANYLTAIAAMGQELYGLVTDFGDDPDDPSWVSGWSVLFDVDLCPTKYLPFLAQMVGSTIPAGTSDADARTIIRSEQSQQRGLAASIRSAVQRYLTGTKTCTLLERTAADGSANAYALTIIVRPEELAVNLVPNPSFEHDTVGSPPAGYTVNGTLTSNNVARTWASHGSQSAELIMPTQAGVFQVPGLLSTAIAVIPGETFTLSAVANVVSLTGTAQAILAVNVPSVGYSFYQLSSLTGIQNMAVTFTVASGVTSINAAVGFDTSTNAGANAAGHAYFDDVMLTAGTQVRPYADGDTGSNAWVGTPGNSVSTALPAVIAAINATKPAGITTSITQTDGFVWSSATHVWTADAFSWAASDTTAP